MYCLKKMNETPTRNIAKSGEVLIWSGFSPFQLCLSLIGNHSQSTLCHIAKRYKQGKKTEITSAKYETKIV